MSEQLEALVADITEGHALPRAEVLAALLTALTTPVKPLHTEGP